MGLVSRVPCLQLKHMGQEAVGGKESLAEDR